MRALLIPIVLGALVLLITFAEPQIPLQVPDVATSTASSPLAPTTTPIAASETQGIRVVRVIDGDTIVLDIDGSDTRVRVIGLDTPETVDPREKLECFGEAASAKAREMLEGTFVRLEEDASQGKYDKYGRLLAYVYLADGTLFNEYMIREGYGHEYTYRIPYKYQTQFKTAERDARENKRGLWADHACESLP